MLSSTVCASGAMKAPQMPCSTRNITISSRLFARPHSADAMVKPTTEKMNSRFWPIRSDIQPVSGVAMAAATM